MDDLVGGLVVLVVLVVSVVLVVFGVRVNLWLSVLRRLLVVKWKPRLLRRGRLLL
jgi:hypothetical protein